MQQPVILICSTVETFKRIQWLIPIVFQWCETLIEIRKRIGRGNREEKFHLFLFDETIQIDLNEFLQMENIAGVEICYKVACSQRIKHDKLRYTSVKLCLPRWHYIEHKSSQLNAQHFANSRSGRQIDCQRRAEFHRKELMKVTGGP